jgi:hypothetical protein
MYEPHEEKIEKLYIIGITHSSSSGEMVKKMKR